MIKDEILLAVLLAKGPEDAARLFIQSIKNGRTRSECAQVLAGHCQQMSERLALRNVEATLDDNP